MCLPWLIIAIIMHGKFQYLKRLINNYSIVLYLKLATMNKIS